MYWTERLGLSDCMAELEMGQLVNVIGQMSRHNLLVTSTIATSIVHSKLNYTVTLSITIFQNLK